MNSAIDDSPQSFSAGSLAQGKKILVIGGSGNIGQATCRLLAAEGAELAFTYFSNKSAAETLAESIDKCFMLHCDSRDAALAQQCVAEASQLLGGLDAVVQCSGSCAEASFYQHLADREVGSIRHIGFDHLQAQWQAHALSAFNICQAASAAMLDNGGSIVLLGSMVCCKAVPTPIHFSMSKTAMVGLVESLAKDVGAANIKVNIIAPGLVEGGASASVAEALKQSYVKYSALKRLAHAEEIAQAILWMAAQNSYVTGQCILLDGGL